ncbi:MAG: hypothetical protein LBM98_02120 [Oscillospiraceae bacterium]|jgi:hypothetical protein|nr:hypothetical protein [Oscillospiraceae bacterium]
MMKKILFLAIILTLLASCNAANPAPAPTPDTATPDERMDYLRDKFDELTEISCDELVKYASLSDGGYSEAAFSELITRWSAAPGELAAAIAELDIAGQTALYKAIYNSANAWGLTAEFEQGLKTATEQELDLTILKRVIAES